MLIEGGGGGWWGGGRGERGETKKNTRSRVRLSVTKQTFLNRIVVISLSVCWVT